MPDKPWIPRASSLGYYFTCEYRAAIDRAIHEGLVESAIPQQDNKYADFGTMCHWRTQELVNATFSDGAEPPTAEQVESASGLYNGDTSACRTMVELVANRAAERLGRLGLPWLAETEHKLPFLSGHIDFISPDYSTIVDLKTTGRKPNHNRIKPAHYVQMIAYWLLTHRTAKKGYVLYVDSAKASWSLMCELDYTSPAVEDMANHMLTYIAYLMSDRLEESCVPHLGGHCSDEFCPHRDKCRDFYIPQPGEVDDDKVKLTAIKTAGL